MDKDFSVEPKGQYLKVKALSILGRDWTKEHWPPATASTWEIPAMMGIGVMLNLVEGGWHVDWKGAS